MHSTEAQMCIKSFNELGTLAWYTDIKPQLRKIQNWNKY